MTNTLLIVLAIVPWLIALGYFFGIAQSRHVQNFSVADWQGRSVFTTNLRQGPGPRVYRRDGTGVLREVMVDVSISPVDGKYVLQSVTPFEGQVRA